MREVTSSCSISCCGGFGGGGGRRCCRRGTGGGGNSWAGVGAAGDEAKESALAGARGRAGLTRALRCAGGLRYQAAKVAVIGRPVQVWAADRDLEVGGQGRGG